MWPATEEIPPYYPQVPYYARLCVHPGALLSQALLSFWVPYEARLSNTPGALLRKALRRAPVRS